MRPCPAISPESLLLKSCVSVKIGPKLKFKELAKAIEYREKEFCEYAWKRLGSEENK